MLLGDDGGAEGRHFDKQQVAHFVGTSSAPGVAATTLVSPSPAAFTQSRCS
jgi:hypothetical protein